MVLRFDTKLFSSLFLCIFIVSSVVAPPPNSDINGAQTFRLNQISQTNGALSNLAHGALAIAAINSLDPCKYFENITDIQQLNHHEVVAFEQCLYYFLANRAQHQAASAFGAVHPIATLPPNFAVTGARKGAAGSQIKVRVGQITLQHFQLNEFLKDLHIVGHLEMGWGDSRLSWDQSQFKVDKLQIHSANHIWIPILSSQAYDTSLRNDDSMEVRRLDANNAGNVTAIVSFSLKTFCDDSDFRHYPDDIYKCCFVLEPHFNQELIEFTVDGLPVFTDPKYFRDYGWSMSGTIPTVNSDPNVISQLNFCINLQRTSSALKIELAVPTWASAFILLFTPLFGPIRTQIYVKLFLLLIQILILHLYSNRIAPYLGSAAATPVLMAVHELAIVLNVLSIIFSVVVSMLSRIPRSLPPWGWLIKISQITNRFIFIFNTIPENQREENALSGGIDNLSYYYNPANDEVEKAPNNGTKTIPSKSAQSPAQNPPTGNGRYQADWRSAFLALHALGVTILSIFFIFGYLLIR